MNFLSQIFSKKEAESDSGFQVIDGKVVFNSEIEESRTDNLKEFGALIFIGMNGKEPAFIPAEAGSHHLIFHRLRIDRFKDGEWQPDDIPAISTETPFEIAEDEEQPPDPKQTAPTPEPEKSPEPVKQKDPEPALANPPARYPESFLVEGLMSDFGGFIDHLKETGKTKHTASAYALDIRHWRKELNGVFSPEAVKDVLLKCPSVSRRNRMLSTLKTYGKYRLLYGDHRVILLLSTSPDIKRIREIQKPREILPKEIMETYLLKAEHLCKEGDRIGIWMALSLYGFKPSEFIRIKITKTSGSRKTRLVVKRKGNKIYKIPAPAWLIKPMQALPKKKWGAARTTIHKGLKRYGTSPKELYNAIGDHADMESDTDHSARKRR